MMTASGMGEPIQTEKEEEEGGEGGGGRSPPPPSSRHQYCSKIAVKELNEHLMCVLCGGYFIDATTILECLHSFCRSCIVRYLESSKYCPICDVQVHKTRPLFSIRSDKTLQDLVYKLVPRLFDEEMRRRREFLKAHPEVTTSRMDLEQKGHAQMVPVHSLPGQKISLVLHMAVPGESVHSEPKRSTARSKNAGEKHYLLCPSDVTMGILKKFIRCKFNLSEKYQIDLFYTRPEEAINDDFTLLDVTFVYSWTREKPLRLFYLVCEKPRRKRRLPADRLLTLQSSQAKRPRMEPPDLNGNVSNGPLHQASRRPPPPQAKLKKPGVGRPPSKAGSSSSQSFQRSKQVRKADFWKLHSREKLKAKRLPLENAKQAGRGRKRKAEVPPSPSPEKAGDRKRACSGEAKSKTEVGSEQLLNGRPISNKIMSECEKNGAGDSKSTGGRPPSGACSGGKENGTAVNGVLRPALRTSLDSRSASPRQSTPGSSRSSSPRSLPAARAARAGSPRAKTSLRVCPGAKDSVSVSSPQHEDEVKLSRARDGSRPCSRGSSRADSPPRPADMQTVLHADRFPSSLPVSEKISVDVSMTTSSASETSSDVTSPGAEDRANSTSMEEAGEFHGSAGLMCNVSTFAPRPFPTLMQTTENAVGNKHSTEPGYRQNGNKNDDSRLSKEKIHTHKEISAKGNGGFKPNLNKNGGRTTTNMHKLNGHREDDESEKKNHGLMKNGKNHKLNKEAKRTKSK